MEQNGAQTEVGDRFLLVSTDLFSLLCSVAVAVSYIHHNTSLYTLCGIRDKPAAKPKRNQTYLCYLVISKASGGKTCLKRNCFILLQRMFFSKRCNTYKHVQFPKEFTKICRPHGIAVSFGDGRELGRGERNEGRQRLSQR